ncbi:MAG: hypothetical protein U9R25_15665 [Chloroflexota bacterium]|nr:hypothetical protein [Chloroflexota bacterium]
MSSLERLAGWYKNGEEEFYTRDIGSLFSGLPNRFEAPNAWSAISNKHNPVRVWVYLALEGLDPALSGAMYEGHDPDSNVHHWAWALTIGGSYGALAAGVINTGREVTQFRGNWFALASDVWLGNRGALLGEHFATVGIRDVRQAWGLYMVR